MRRVQSADRSKERSKREAGEAAYRTVRARPPVGKRVESGDRDPDLLEHPVQTGLFCVGGLSLGTLLLGVLLSPFCY